MWLPDPIYKALPMTYAVIGVAFFLGVVYVGADAPLGPVYLGMGVIAILASITITIWRKRHARQKVDTDSPQTDSAQSD